MKTLSGLWKLFVVALSLAAYSFAAIDTPTSHRYAAKTPAFNPMKGWNISIYDQPGPFPVAMTYVKWQDIQTETGVYNWNRFESNLAGFPGKHLVPRVYAHYFPTDNPSVAPNYLFSRLGIKFFKGTNSAGQAVYCIDYNDVNFVNEVCKTIRDMGARYDGDPRIYAFEVGFLGYWGENHCGDFFFSSGPNMGQGYILSNQTYQAVVDAYKAAFKKTKIMARQPDDNHPAFQSSGFGFHGDSFAADQWEFDHFDTPINTFGFWRNAPIGGEVRPGTSITNFYIPSSFGPTGMQCLQQGHYATMQPSQCKQSPGDPWYSNFVAMNAMMGYHYRISDARFSDTNLTGFPLVVSVKGTNVGRTPLYYDWNVEFAILDSANNPRSGILSPVALTGIMPGDEFQFNASVPVGATLPPGNYKLAVRIIQPGAAAVKASPWPLWSSNAVIQFGNAFPLGYVQPSWSSSNSINGGWSILGNVSFISNAKLIVSGFPPNAITNRTFSFNAKVSGNFGYVSTNLSGPYQAFTTNGTNISVNGTSTYWYFASNAASGASITNSNTYVIDTVAPVVKGFPASLRTNTSFTLRPSVNENTGYYSVGLVGGFLPITTNGLNLTISNDVTFRYYSVDAAGNRSATNTVTYLIDNTAPSVWASPAIWGSTNTPFWMTFTTSENFGYISTNSAAGPWIQYSTSGTNLWISRTGNIWFYGRDDLGNQTVTNTRWVSFDTNAPTVRGFLSSRTTNASFLLNLSVDENDGFIATNAAGPFSSFKTNGTNILVSQSIRYWYFARDNAGNSSTTNSVSYTVLTGSAPVVSGFPFNFTTSASFAINVGVNKNFGYLATNAAGPFTSFTTNGTNILVNATTTFWYYGRDTLGNNSATNARTYTFDRTAPTVSGFPANFTTNASFALTLGVNENFGYFATNATGPYTVFTMSGTNVTVNATTTFWYYGRDILGNTSATNTVSYSVLTGSAPVVSGFPFSFTTNASFAINIGVNKNFGYFATNATGPFTSFTTNGTNVSVNATTTFWYYGRDALGNNSATNARTYTFDRTAPTVSGFPANFTTNASFVLALGVNENFGYFATNATGPYTVFTISGTNVTVSATTTFWYYGRDALGNTSATNTATYSIQVPNLNQFSDLKVQNNPYRAGSGGVIFNQLPQKTVIQISSLSGSVLNTFETPAGESTAAVWNVRDKNGRPVGPGIYFALLSSASLRDHRLIKIIVVTSD